MMNHSQPLTNSETEAEKIELIAHHYEEIIRLIGENPEREGLLKTPMRAAKALYYCTKGYRQDPQSIINDAIFAHDGSQMIIVKDIEFYSFCEHHILPFFGTVSIGYLPKGKIIGISKLARLVDMYARRLQVQERMTAQICEELQRQLQCDGVIVSCNAQHLCMKMRGVEKQNSSTTTLHATGRMSEPTLQAQFFNSLAH